MKSITPLLLLLPTLWVAGEQALAEDIVFDSGLQQNQLIELYTSEGCSSCPPADRWLSSLKQRGPLWNDIIPVAFHVDYWDRLGWPDRFAQRQYSDRQRAYARLHRESTVYTPGVRRNGYEWRSWRGLKGRDPSIEGREVGALKIAVTRDGQFSANFKPLNNSDSQTYILNVAVLGMEAITQVQRGENRGKQLKHDFVVLAHEDFTAGVTPKAKLQWQGSLPAPTSTAPQYALAAWISTASSLNPIQATGGNLPLFPQQ